MSDAPIPAATLVLMRPALDGPPEILSVVRAATMTFAGGAVVFPGGRVDDADRTFAADIGVPEDAAKITAIRETIEESGIAAGLAGPVDPSVGLALQDALLGGARFDRELAAHGLSLDLDALTPFARWMPGFKHARVFDTLFFLARAPTGDWPPRPQPGECEAAEWASAATLLERIDAGNATAIFPTKRNLERLAGYSDFDAALAGARAHSIDTIIPWIEEIDGEPHVRIPDDRGYPVVAEPLRTAFRA